MRHAAAALVCTVLVASGCAVDTHPHGSSAATSANGAGPWFTPTQLMPQAAEVGAFLRDWYSRHLAAMREPPLSHLAQPAWRFLWLRSFHPAIAVRVEPVPGGGDGGLVTATWLDGMGGYDPGAVVRRHEVRLNAAQWASLRTDLAAAGLAKMEPLPDDELLEFDGAQWVLEQWCDDRHVVVQRRSPRPPSRIRSACLTLLATVAWQLQDEEVY